MKENGVGKTLRIIGILVAVCGILVGAYLYATSENLLLISIAVVIGSFISGMLFIGFAEVIFLLQDSVNVQEKILSKEDKILFHVIESRKKGQTTTTYVYTKPMANNTEEE